MKLYIKNMVCPRCIMSVEQILQKNQLSFSYVRLGEVSLNGEPSKEKVQQLATDLKSVGFELLDDQRKQQIEQVKSLLIGKVQSGEIEEHFSLTKFLSSSLHRDYSHVSKLFSEVEGITIEQFFILQKVEKTKEWLIYNEYSLNQIAIHLGYSSVQHPLNQIAIHLGYSSVQHLSSQFKKVTGMTPSEFKKIGTGLRKPLDSVK
jgi:AraC family transcriptional regulator